MHGKSIDYIAFLARYAPYAVLAGLWLAYVGNAPLWWGGAAGFGASLMLMIPALVSAAQKPRAQRDRLQELLD